MILIVGLGNPRKEYAKSRHNAGWVVLDVLEQEISKPEYPISKKVLDPHFEFIKKFDAKICQLGDLLLAKPQTFMNFSGIAVGKLVYHYQVFASNLWVIHDDLDIRLGEYKIQFGKGPREHRGLLSIYEKLGTKDFWHVRIGVDNRGSDNRTPGEKYVLQKFTEEELAFLKEVSLEVTKELLNRLAI